MLLRKLEEIMESSKGSKCQNKTLGTVQDNGIQNRVCVKNQGVHLIFLSLHRYIWAILTLYTYITQLRGLPLAGTG